MIGDLLIYVAGVGSGIIATIVYLFTFGKEPEDGTEH